MTRKTPRLDEALNALTALVRTYKARCLALSMAVTLLLALIVWNATASRPGIWAPDEVPVAFWSWRLETPSETDVNEAVRQTGTKTLFMRAGQIDYEAGKLSRIRAVSGSIPRSIAVHLVYNATRSFLKEFERIGADAAGSTVLDAFDQDLDRANSDHAQVMGLQLDFDVPTRLLTNYAAILKKVRKGLSNEVKLSRSPVCQRGWTRRR